MATSYDGSIIIGTRVDQSGLEKGIQEIDKKIKQLKNKRAEYTTSSGARVHENADFSLEEKELEYYNRLLATREKLRLKLVEENLQERQKTDELRKASIEFQKQTDATQQQANNVDQATVEIEKLSSQLEEMVENYNRMQNQDIVSSSDVEDAKQLKKDIIDLANRIEQLSGEKITIKGITDMKNDMPNIKDAMSNIVRSVAKWGLALFGIRSAYNFIRSSMSLLVQDNEQISVDIEYMRWVIANTLKPIIETIINLAYKLLQYINYIASAWFGVNLFANASAEAFKETKNQVKGTTNEAKKLQKTLAGFDEMNILQENGSTSSGGGGGGIALPTTDLANMLTDVDIPEWVKWIAEHKDEIIGAIIGIAQAFAVWKVLQWVNELGLFAEGIGLVGKALQGVGIALIIIGIWQAVGDLITLITEPSWDNFKNLINDISIAMAGLGVVLIGINASNPFGWVTLAIGALGYLITSLTNTTTKEEEERQSMKRQQEAAEALKEARDKLTQVYDTYGDAVQNAEAKETALKKIEDETGLSGEALYKIVKNNYNAYKEFSPEQRKVYDAYVDNINAQLRLQEATQDVIDTKRQELANIGVINSELFKNGKAYDDNFNSMMEGLRTGETSWEDFEHTISTLMSTLTAEQKYAFTQTLPEDIRVGMQKMYENAQNPLSQFFNAIDNTMGNSTNSVWNLFNAISNVTNLLSKLSGRTITFKVGGVSNGYAKGGLVTRLATGGIVNQPNRGVPLANAITGEAGREGIVPLTDSQAMETLGQAIGKYISLNATIPVYVGNRQVAKELKRIETEDAFAMNG